MLETRRSCFAPLLVLDDLFLFLLALMPRRAARPKRHDLRLIGNGQAGKSNRAKNSLGTIMSSVSNGKRFGVSWIGGRRVRRNQDSIARSK